MNKNIAPKLDRKTHNKQRILVLYNTEEPGKLNRIPFIIIM